MLANLHHGRRGDDRDGDQTFRAPDFHGGCSLSLLPALFSIHRHVLQWVVALHGMLGRAY
jgi:hypothetical protein